LVLVDKKILSGGIAMLVVGTSLTLYLDSIVPLGVSGMTEEEKLDLLIKQRENQDMKTLAGILIGIGFLLVLVSFGARRRKGGPKQIIKKPAE
jgi:hypothetical protein